MPERLYPGELDNILNDKQPCRLVVLSLDYPSPPDPSVIYFGNPGTAPVLARALFNSKMLAGVAVLPMPVSVEARTVLLKTFYRGLINGGDTDHALNQCQKAMGKIQNGPKWFFPLLYSDPGKHPGNKAAEGAVNKEQQPAIVNLSNAPGVGNWFVGRSAPLIVMEDSFSTHKKRCVFVHGPHGIGKSSLAVKSACNTERFKAVTCIKLEAHTSFNQVLDNLARFIDYVNQGGFYTGFYKAARDIDRKVDEVFTELRRKPFLVILDNLDTQIAGGKIKDEDGVVLGEKVLMLKNLRTIL